MRDAAQLPAGVVDAIYGRLEDYHGREFDGASPHTERMAVSWQGRRVPLTVVFFVDTDGTLNVEAIELAQSFGRGVLG